MRNLPLFLLALVACGDGPEAPEDFSDCSAAEGDGEPIVESASIEGSTLSLHVQHSGGCEAHVFVLCWPEQAFARSLPPLVSLELWHDDGGDTCEAIESATLTFDLGPLEEAYIDANSSSGTIRINLGGQSLDHSF